MKTAFPLLLVALTLTAADPARRQPGQSAAQSTASEPQTFSSLDKPSARHASVPAGAIKFEEADLSEVLKMYQTISGRTVVRSTTLPGTKITLETHQPVGILKALQLLDTALAQNGIAMVPQGTDIVKAVPAQAAGVEAVPICELAPQDLPESQSYICYIVQLKHHKPRDLAQALQPFAKLPNSILGIDSAGMLVLRDYSVNVKRMLQVLEKIEQTPLREVEDEPPPRRKNVPLPSLPDR
jgi:type II secretory pathway component GspD/PulD (secretin)